MTALLLLLSIALSTGRNLLSGKLSGSVFGTPNFFRRQGILFAAGTLALLVFGTPAWQMPSTETLLLAVIYGALLILTQWFYTIALGAGNTALCSTVYSMGFILPTLSGAVFWSEPFSGLDLVGVLSAVAAILVSGIQTPKGGIASGKRSRGRGLGNTLPRRENATDAPSRRETPRSRRYFVPLLVSMLASGGLGIMQKLQQRSSVADERASFLVIAFLLAALLSCIAALTVRRTRAPLEEVAPPRAFWVAAGVGIAFGSCNLLNTALAGRLPGAIFFPTLNIGVILCTMLCGILFLRERLGKRECAVLILGGLSILLLNLG